MWHHYSEMLTRSKRLSTYGTWETAPNFEGIFWDLWDTNKAESSSSFLTLQIKPTKHSVVQLQGSARDVTTVCSTTGPNQRFKHRNVRETHAKKKERNISLRVGLLSQGEAFQLHSRAFGDVNKLRELNFNLWLIFTHHTWGEMQMSLGVSVKRRKKKS